MSQIKEQIKQLLESTQEEVVENNGGTHDRVDIEAAATKLEEFIARQFAKYVNQIDNVINFLKNQGVDSKLILRLMDEEHKMY